VYSFEDSTGWRHSCFEIFHHRDKPCDSAEAPCPLRALLNTKQPVIVNHRHLGKDGRETYYEILASPVFNETGEMTQVVETCRDITNKLQLEQARKKLDEQFHREQKEQSIMTLADGIAHDFNNGLMGMLGNAELLKMKLSSDAREQELVRNILASGRHMAHLTRQLLAYAKGGRYLPEILFLGKPLEEALGLARKGKAADSEAVLDLAQDLAPVFADAGQITQVLINLFTNAFEAMEGGKGKLTVYALNVWRDAWECTSLRHEHPAGKYVHIRIADTGSGIPPGLHKRIFEPFYTTKFMGRGLGLAAAMGIVQNHNGCISVESEPGRGSVFHVYLPAAEAPVKESRAGIVQTKNTAMQNSILIVDDDPQIRALVESMLERMGKRTHAAGSGAEALEIFKREQNTIVLAILDIQMSGMDGKTLFRKLKELKPQLKVLISSGYDETAALEGLGADGPEGFIQKPYWINALEEKVKELLHGSRPSEARPWRTRTPRS
jgi:signal transduction histidine kinase/CheY-like chemotaxis protein